MSMRFFITGHTGFKGAWLTKMLLSENHEVYGYSLPAEQGSIFQDLNLGSRISAHFQEDVRNKLELSRAMTRSDPQVVVHLAAQPLVIRGYQEPYETFETNVSGTLNVLSAASKLESSPTVLIVTTDKVYKPKSTSTHLESDALGGLDPYSASKAMADLLSQSWAKSFSKMNIGVARAGNVIGPFDHSEKRLLPDIMRSLKIGATLNVRFPGAVRPWQHVLDCLNGYLSFIGNLRQGQSGPRVLNFGPDPEDIRQVQSVLNVVANQNSNFKYRIGDVEYPENPMLTLSNSLAKSLLKWDTVIPFQEAIELSIRFESTPSEIESEIDRQITLHSERLGHKYVQE
jgi:CDP-glucose 4,6-dehydratase